MLWLAVEGGAAEADGPLLWEASRDRVTALVRQAVAASQPGARRSLVGQRVTPITWQAALHQAWQDNPTIARQRQRRVAAGYGVTVAASAFAPVLSLAVTSDRYRTYERSEVIGRLRAVPEDWEQFEQEAQAALDPEFRATSTGEQCTTIDGIPVGGGGCSHQVAYAAEAEYAGYDVPYWKEAWSGAAKFSQRFRGGVQAEAIQTSRFVPYENKKAATLSGEMMQMATNIADSEWASNLVVRVSAPLPYSKNAGAEGDPLVLAEDLARLNRLAVAERLADTENQVLRDVAVAYLELVRATLRLDSAMARLRVAEAHQAQTGRLLAVHRATRYDQVQVEAELAQVREQEETAWLRWVTTSGRLGRLLNLPPAGRCLTPAGEVPKLAAAPPAVAEAVETALTAHPRLAAARAELEASTRRRGHARRQQRPELAFSGAYNLGESTSVFGYHSLSESLAGLGRADTRNYYLGLTLTLPLGNQAAKAAHQRAVAGQRRSQEQLRLAENRVAEEVNLGLASLRGAEAQSRLADAHHQQAAVAYQHADRLRQEDRVSDFQVIRRLQELQQADHDRIDAWIGQQQAWIAHQAAQGAVTRSLLAPERQAAVRAQPQPESFQAVPAPTAQPKRVESVRLVRSQPVAAPLPRVAPKRVTASVRAPLQVAVQRSKKVKRGAP